VRSTIRQRVHGGLARAVEKGSVWGAQDDVATEARTQGRLRAGVGVIKAVRECSIGVGTVQRVKAEMEGTRPFDGASVAA
jgi:DNA invertase Pin-like site-specific DNA recombinase